VLITINVFLHTFPNPNNLPNLDDEASDDCEIMRIEEYNESEGIYEYDEEEDEEESPYYQRNVDIENLDSASSNQSPSLL
jgi:hypothetical protein